MYDADVLPTSQLCCPVCGAALSLDPAWPPLRWQCGDGHSYSLRVLVSELRRRGWEPAIAMLPSQQC